jgi:acyl carrier protein
MRRARDFGILENRLKTKPACHSTPHSLGAAAVLASSMPGRAPGRNAGGGMMNLSEVRTKVREILSRELELADASIGDDTTMDSVPLWDSVKHVDIFFALQDTFGVEFEHEETELMTSYPLIVEMVMKKLEAVGQ